MCHEECACLNARTGAHSGCHGLDSRPGNDIYGAPTTHTHIVVGLWVLEARSGIRDVYCGVLVTVEHSYGGQRTVKRVRGETVKKTEEE